MQFDNIRRCGKHGCREFMGVEGREDGVCYHCAEERRYPVVNNGVRCKFFLPVEEGRVEGGSSEYEVSRE